MVLVETKRRFLIKILFPVIQRKPSLVDFKEVYMGLALRFLRFV